MKDSNGIELKAEMLVDVPEPNSFDDLHQHAFIGAIVGFRGEHVQVADQMDDVFELEPERLTIIN